MRPCVLHIAKASGISGSENHLLLLLPALRERGIDARFLMLHEDEVGAWELARRLDEAGVPVEGIRLPRAASPAALARLVSAIRRLRPDIVHTHLVHADFYGLAAARLARVPVLASTKHGFNTFRDRRSFALADRATVIGVDLHVAISAGLARYLAQREGFSEREFEIVHYGIEAGTEPPQPPAPDRLAIVGRLIPIKGHETLFAALRELPDVRLEVAGDGPLEHALRELAAPLGERISFLGRVAPAASVLERAGIVIVPSLGEGFGMVALEAMERGRAVVASAIGGLPELVVDGVTGLVVPPSEPDALREAIRSLLGDPERARMMGAAGRRRALEAFSQTRNTERMAELYAAVLGRPRRARRLRHARSSANAASTASRKSHGAR